MSVKAVICGLLLETDEHRQQILDAFRKEFGEDIKILGRYHTLPGHGGEGGRSDVVIELPDGIIPKASIHPWHLEGRYRWADDFLDGSRDIVPQEALKQLFGDGNVPACGVTREEFQAYEKVREGGETNMYDLTMVEHLSGYVLDREKIKAIMKNYGELMTFYPGVRKE